MHMSFSTVDQSDTNGEKIEECERPSTTESQDQSGSPGSKDYSCERCNKSFTTKKYLRSHLKTIHESPRLFICPLCGKQLAREKGLNQHIRTIHEGNWSVFCSLCGKGFINRCRLKKHCVNVHERSSRFPCPICDKGFTSEAYRIHHMELVHHNSTEDREALAKHELAVLNSSGSLLHSGLGIMGCNSPMDCTDLSTNLPTSSDDQPLDLSIRKYRPVSPQQMAPIRTCFQLSNTVQQQQQHSFPEVSSTSRGPVTGVVDLQHSDGEDPSQCKDPKGCRYNCTYCGKSFASKEYLRLHEATVHEGTKAFVCSACGKHFSVHQALRKHYIIQHEGGKPYRCRDCKMEFRTRASLRSHRSTMHDTSAGLVAG